MPRKTDSNNPADWLLIAESDLEALRVIVEKEVGYPLCVSKLAEVLEKVLKAELIRSGWFLENTHDLQRLAGHLRARRSDITDEVRSLCAELSERYFTDRYPGFDLEDPDWPGARRKLEQITARLVKVKGRLK